MRNLDEILDSFIKRVQDYLIQRNINAVQLAKELNISNKSLYSWLNRTRVPKIDSICLIADYLGVSVDYLLGREN